MYAGKKVIPSDLLNLVDFWRPSAYLSRFFGGSPADYLDFSGDELNALNALSKEIAGVETGK